ncbi:hypothetical protein BD324DRAFT_682817 [Kockovaella imperatae]|uniref:Uncharacterized protein n=1 Tax=Kockovaella imperatae TaxID=4999 RepID=A0A1Y1UBS0_9TREE|nr:hypothetical protein BD324DRAFT_682817 [Kockovaella imperatae]ORX35490.1 hypothetical protein BD324DRAFT_682817 [Kockovaella imperatae]
MPSKTRSEPIKPLDDLGTLAQTYFTPHLRRPRLVQEPIPPSLAASRLPPPCAEVDERPRWRYRRFKRWQDAVVPLRKAVVDQNRRAHLRRYQTFAIPSNPVVRRGLSAIQWTPAQTPHPSRLSAPVQEAVLDHHLLSSEHSSPSPLVQPFPYSPPRPQSYDGWGKLPKAERRARRLRLLQFKYALDQEHERRFRLAMASVIPDLIAFESKFLTQFFRDIRKKSSNIWHWVDPTRHQPVSRRQEIHAAVKKTENERKARKERRSAMQQNKLQAQSSAIAPAPPPRQAPESIAKNLTGISGQRRTKSPKTPAARSDEDGLSTSPDLTDGSTASETGIRTPTSKADRPRKLATLKTAPVSTSSPPDAGPEAIGTKPSTLQENAPKAKRSNRSSEAVNYDRDQSTPRSASGRQARSLPLTPFEPTELCRKQDQTVHVQDLERLLSLLRVENQHLKAGGVTHNSPADISGERRRTAPRHASHRSGASGKSQASRSDEDESVSVAIETTKNAGSTLETHTAEPEPYHQQESDIPIQMGNMSSGGTARLANLEDMVPRRPDIDSIQCKIRIPETAANLHSPDVSAATTSAAHASSSPLPLGDLNIDVDTALPVCSSSTRRPVSRLESEHSLRVDYELEEEEDSSDDSSKLSGAEDAQSHDTADSFDDDSTLDTDLSALAKSAHHRSIHAI